MNAAFTVKQTLWTLRYWPKPQRGLLLLKQFGSQSYDPAGRWSSNYDYASEKEEKTEILFGSETDLVEFSDTMEKSESLQQNTQSSVVLTEGRRMAFLRM